MGEISYFLGIKFPWTKQKDDLTIHLTQEAFADTLIKTENIPKANTITTPYRSGQQFNAISTPPPSYAATPILRQ